MTARRVTLLLVVVLAYYLLVAGERGLTLLRDPRLAFKGLGVGVLALPLLGALLVVGELRFGRDTERLGRQLSAEGGLDEAPDLPRLPSGRIDPAAADEAFRGRRAEVEAAPGDWRRWYRLALAYSDARDTPRGRKAMRRAVALWKDEQAL